MVRRFLVGVVAAVAAFHVWIFGGQIVAGELASPGRIARWALAGLVAGAFWSLRRRGDSLTRGRKAVALWTLAALLHGPVLAERFESVSAFDSAPVVVFEVVPALVGAALAVSALRRSEFLRRTFEIVGRTVERDVAFEFVLVATEAPRPPPANQLLVVS